ncbi:tRNA pseudouridine(38-40) synthase TruA [Prevotella sp. S7 MS 2]|uniref:tRNA pseudouridine(38-40) synthase TruA n=1 Tax=Prevotella sp. S7 MS 2 TaxID=1287488 RepID=UPI00051338C9|nr:tRNA pseudouridine(38-40) synthase TruA [Prevotella sp. S7 MS 2]KGI61480.1 pseudouridine synthase [Prevotella sp. S7 MS 2]
MMEKRYFIWLRYDGTRYHGWQIQPNGNSVQNEIQKALSLLLREQVEIVGAGRTDAGVHARMMAAHFDTEAVFECAQLAYRMNSLLPRDISIDKIEEVENDLHARFSAKSRTYHYFIHQGKNPFLNAYSCELRYPLDFNLMNEAARRLLEVKDFAAFCKTHTDVKTTLCDVTEAHWMELPDKQYMFVITANRFLRNMVRAVVGTLLDVGKHRLTLEEFDEVVKKGNRSNAGESMPAKALFLEKVVY